MAVQSNVDSAFNLQHSNFKFSPRRRNVETLLGCPFGYELGRRKSRYVYPYFIRIDFVIFFLENFFNSKAKIYVTFNSTISKNNFRIGIILRNSWSKLSILLSIYNVGNVKTFLALRMQKIHWIPISKFVFREREVQVFILISLIPTLALSRPLRKPNLLVFIHLKFTLNFLYSNFASFKPELYRKRFIEFHSIHLLHSLIWIGILKYNSSQVRSLSTHVSDIQRLRQLGHESKMALYRIETIKQHTLNQYINETDPKYSNYDPIPTHFIPSNITPLFSHSHVNHTNRKISRRLYQTPATLPFYSIMGAQILQPLPGTRAIGRPRGAHAHNSTRSIPCVSHTHAHGRAHDSNLIKHRGSRL